MKIFYSIVCAGVLGSAICAGISACNKVEESDEPDVGTLPVEVFPYLEALLNTHFPKYYKLATDPVFFEEYEGDETVCFVINSDDEFSAVAPSDIVLPPTFIDFDKYSLVIGRITGGFDISIDKQGINTEPDTMILNLVHYRKQGEALELAWGERCFFRGLYPKLPRKPISVNVINQYK